MRKRLILLGLALCGCAVLVWAFEGTGGGRMQPEDLPTSNLISTAGPSFTAPHVREAAVVIVFGDQRFTDPNDTKVTNPKVRRWLVQQIADEKPDAILLNGDVPYNGGDANDYEVYKAETKVWRDRNLNVYPALGNHEFHGDPQEALEHWWNAFPELRNRRWYSVGVGKSIYTIAVDSDTSLLNGSDQQRWLDQQLTHLPSSTKFVIISLHHPPVADFQTRVNVSHNPRPNEIALRDYLEGIAPRLHAQIIVSAGHIHNYERTIRGGITYLVSGGGGAAPVPVDRAPEDLYQSKDFPNYHYIKFVLERDSLHARMYRLADANAASPSWQVRDEFTITARPGAPGAGR